MMRQALASSLGQVLAGCERTVIAWEGRPVSHVGLGAGRPRESPSVSLGETNGTFRMSLAGQNEGSCDGLGVGDIVAECEPWDL